MDIVERSPDQAVDDIVVALPSGRQPDVLITAAEALRPVAEALVLEMGAEPVWIQEQDRPMYHAGLAHGANHLVTLVAQAMQVVRSAGVQDPQRLVAPLLHAALDNALRLGDGALTGPVARGDAGTVAAHLSQLTQQTPDIRPTYVALARATAERALASGRLIADHITGVESFIPATPYLPSRNLKGVHQ